MLLAYVIQFKTLVGTFVSRLRDKCLTLVGTFVSRPRDKFLTLVETFVARLRDTVLNTRREICYSHAL